MNGRSSRNSVSVLSQYGAFRKRAIEIAAGGKFSGWRSVTEELRREGHAEADSFMSPPNFRTEIDRLCNSHVKPRRVADHPAAIPAKADKSP